MVSVILLMAGKGTRMKEDKNKILLPLNNKMIFQYPLELFLSFNCEVVCVLAKEDKDIILPLLPEKVKFTFGGKTRQESVLNGLKCCSGEYVLIHDAARPFISKDIIHLIISSYKLDEAILVYQNVKDTIKIKNEAGLQTLSREQLISASTPQCASLQLFKEAYKKSFEENFIATDDISLIEKYYPNTKIRYILANEENFKITTPLDYKLAQVIMEMKK